MDLIDKELIALLQENARISLKAMEEKVYLSSPAVSARINRLVQERDITGFHASVNTSKLGYPIQAFINLEIDPEQKNKFYLYIRTIPNVLECDCITGSYSMLIKVCFADTGSLDTFINQLQYFGKTRTQIVFSTHVEPRGVAFQTEAETKE